MKNCTLLWPSDNSGYFRRQDLRPKKYQKLTLVFVSFVQPYRRLKGGKGEEGEEGGRGGKRGERRRWCEMGHIYIYIYICRKNFSSNIWFHNYIVLAFS